MGAVAIKSSQTVAKSHTAASFFWLGNIMPVPSGILGLTELLKLKV